MTNVPPTGITNVWWAVGPVCGGEPRMHDAYGTFDATLLAKSAASGAAAPVTVERRSLGQWLSESPSEQPFVVVLYIATCLAAIGATLLAAPWAWDAGADVAALFRKRDWRRAKFVVPM